MVVGPRSGLPLAGQMLAGALVVGMVGNGGAVGKKRPRRVPGSGQRGRLERQLLRTS